MQVFWGTFFLVLSILLPPALIILGVLLRKEKYGIHFLVIGIIQLLFFLLAVSSSPSFFQTYIEVVGSLFSDITTGTVIVSFIIAIIPSMISSALNYRPKDFLGYCSRALFWCATIFLVIISPLSLLLCFLYRRMYMHHQKRAASQKSVQSKPSSPPSASLPSVRPAIPEVRLPSYRICHFMWIRSIIFCEQIQKNPSLLSKTYIWTAYFYSITKYFRDQQLVDDIYSQFKQAAEPFISAKENKETSLNYIQLAYWRFRSVLNASGIDPRNHDGIIKLWSITAQWAFPEVPVPESATEGFAYNTQLIISQALDIYKLKPTKEHYYLDLG